MKNFTENEQILKSEKRISSFEGKVCCSIIAPWKFQISVVVWQTSFLCGLSSVHISEDGGPAICRQIRAGIKHLYYGRCKAGYAIINLQSLLLLFIFTQDDCCLFHFNRCPEKQTPMCRLVQRGREVTWRIRDSSQGFSGKDQKETRVEASYELECFYWRTIQNDILVQFLTWWGRSRPGVGWGGGYLTLVWVYGCRRRFEILTLRFRTKIL